MPHPEFLKASPFATARRLANRELLGSATPSEVAWLYEHPLIWLRALSRLNLDVKNHIAKSQGDLDAVKPAAGTSADQKYLDLRREWMGLRASRLHFQEVIANRSEDVKALFGMEHFAARVTVGDLVVAFLEFIELVKDDDVDIIELKASGWVRRLTEGQ